MFIRRIMLLIADRNATGLSTRRPSPVVDLQPDGLSTAFTSHDAARLRPSRWLSI
ncbi:hypothetical protein PC128_g25539 [Phytophthora cactorum]|uniref:Uncharacterized protein n=1 Tax=Phytophthora cactorum TaxID=29920 RepID=A0A8T1C5S5_9STRA|nr:hypothetical protein PC117_g18638 [Phytophthora cactorum]KAG3138575.1 hypothetical protein PC128_g25539 [Phytophthora cactorum]KAG4036554.1 hypothetical protein PC123_g27877 [Phytophthora cactorum]KAG4041050.1 hypothetical protein PC123_g23424 [Phytophthora cactorum]